MSDATPPSAEHNPNCFACGAGNDSSLGFRVLSAEPGRLTAEVAFRVHHEGGVGRTHGGVIASALDEVLGQLAQQEFGGDCMTAQLNTRFRAPGATGDVCVAEGVVRRREGRKIWMTGVLRRGDVELATAEGLWLEARPPVDGPAPV